MAPLRIVQNQVVGKGFNHTNQKPDLKVWGTKAESRLQQGEGVHVYRLKSRRKCVAIG